VFVRNNENFHAGDRENGDLADSERCFLQFLLLKSSRSPAVARSAIRNLSEPDIKSLDPGGTNVSAAAQFRFSHQSDPGPNRSSSCPCRTSPEIILLKSSRPFTSAGIRSLNIVARSFKVPLRAGTDFIDLIGVAFVSVTGVRTNSCKF